MLKTLILHLLGGIIAMVARDIVSLLPEYFLRGGLVAASILMVAYYIWAGTFLKNEPLIKTVAFMQTLTYLGHLTYIFGQDIYNYLFFLGGGSFLWNVTLIKFLPENEVSSSFAFASVFLLIPALICIGQIIAGKKLALNITKNGMLLLATVLFNAVLNFIYPIASSFAKKSSAPVFPVGTAVIIMAFICIAFGIIFRKISIIKIYFIMLNISFIGITFSLCFPKGLIVAFSGANILMEKFCKLFSGLDINVTLMFFIPPLFVLLGSFIENKLIKDKTKKADYSGT